MINEYETPNSFMPDPGARAETAAAPTNDEVITVLNNLIQVCKDGQEGFKQASENVGRSDIKVLFWEYSRQRAVFSAELQTHVQSLGGEPEESGSLAGTIQRGWVDFKSAITGDDDVALLSRCESAEDHTIASYKEALDMALPENIRNTVQEQYAAINTTHDRVKALRDAAKGEEAARAHTGL